jgi:hypothetical protein
VGILSLNIYMENPLLTITDLASLRSLIETASERGAFKAGELANVGAVYDKLTAFLLFVQEQAAAEAQQQQAQTQGETNA